MNVAIGIFVALAVLALAVFVYVRRLPRQDAGVVSFRKHIDALSPEARREVMDRVRPESRDERE